MTDLSTNSLRMQCDFSVGDAVINALIWLAITIITLGLGAFLFPYYLPKAVLEKTQMIDQDGNYAGRMVCDISLGQIIGNAILWFFLTIITFGLAYVVYIYRVYRVILNETRLEFD